MTSRSAFVKWNHPDRFTETGENKYPDIDVSDSDFRYEVFISDKSRENRFKSIFTGSVTSCRYVYSELIYFVIDRIFTSLKHECLNIMICRVKDLKPGTTYAIQYCAMIGDVKGQPSTPTSFNTLPAEPEPPQSPKAVSRTRSTIQVWYPLLPSWLISYINLS